MSSPDAVVRSVVTRCRFTGCDHPMPLCGVSSPDAVVRDVITRCRCAGCHHPMPLCGMSSTKIPHSLPPSICGSSARSLSKYRRHPSRRPSLVPSRPGSLSVPQCSCSPVSLRLAPPRSVSPRLAPSRPASLRLAPPRSDSPRLAPSRPA